MNTNVSSETGHQMLAAVFSGRDILKIKKNIKAANRKIDRLENELWFVVKENILWEGATISDIWSVAYESLLLEACDEQRIFGIWVLIHIIQNSELYSDKKQVQAVKQYLDTKFVTPESIDPIGLEFTEDAQKSK
jgi:hypothetical protein